MAWEDVTLGECRLIHGDALEVLPTLPSASVQLILVDPPYGGVKTSYQGEKVLWDRQWPTRDAYLAWVRQMAKEWQRVLTANGSLYCFAAPQMAAWVEVTLSETFNVLNRIQWLKAEGWHKKTEVNELRSYCSPREEIIFAEQYGTQYDDASRALHMQTFAPLGRYIAEERIRAGATRDEVDVALGFVRTKDPSRGTELCRRWEEGNSLPTRETYERLRTYLNSRNGHSDYLRREYEDLRRPFTVSPQVPYTDVWDYATVPAAPGKHPAEKPLPLLRHIITASSRPGDTVLDCCAGSFSTIEAARQCGRKGIGIEQEQQWWAYGQRRLRQETLFAQLPMSQKTPRPVQAHLFAKGDTA
jgi:adenine-specific DNA-methyltransferase